MVYKILRRGVLAILLLPVMLIFGFIFYDYFLYSEDIVMSDNVEIVKAINNESYK